MPLVTRFATRGTFFRQATEPTDWLNGDIWVDTDNANVSVNNSSTAVQVGIGTLGSGLEVNRVNSGATALEYAVLPIGTRAAYFISIESVGVGQNVIFFGVVSGGAAGTETDRDLYFPEAFTWNQMTLDVTTDTTDVDPTVQDRDDAVDGSQIITITGTGRFEDTSNSTTVAANSLIDYIGNGEPTSGTATCIGICSAYAI